jgi:hypothetical protein
MLTTIELVLNFVVLPIALLAAYSCFRPNFAAYKGWFGRLYRAEPALLYVGNVFLMVLGVNAAIALCIHYALFDATLLETIRDAVGIAFMVMLVVFLGMFVKGFVSLRRQGNGAE